MLKSVLTKILSGLMAGILPAFDGIILKKLKSGISTTQDVLHRMGPPTMTWTDANGSQTWEYTRMPYGIVNYMIDFDSNKILRNIRQVLTKENFACVKENMTREQIRRLLGKPAHEFYFSRQKEHVWDWNTMAEAGADNYYFNVHFDEEGRVLRTSTNLISRS